MEVSIRPVKEIDAAQIVAIYNTCCRPDFAIALYPEHLAVREKGFVLNPDLRITSRIPPTLLIQAENDPENPVENSIVYHDALRKAGVPVEMHLYVKGGHAFGLRRTSFPITEWPDVMESWLGSIGMISR